MREKKSCAVEDCTNKHYAKTYCRKHYHRLWRKGTIELYKPEPCIMEGCERGANGGRGMCKNHYSAWYYHNRPYGQINPNHHAYKGEKISYISAHNRVRQIRGHAKIYFCIDCTNQASDWSLKHDAPGMLVVKDGDPRYIGSLYSLDVMDYEPRCRTCHMKYDALHGNKKSREAA